MRYLELPPPSVLAEHVRCVWLLTASPEEAADAERVLPDGCPELVINRADPFRRFGQDGTDHEQSRCLVVGPLSRHLVIAPQGTVDLVGVRFHPGGLAPWLSDAVAALTDTETGGDALGAGGAAELVDAACPGRDAATTVNGLTDVLVSRRNHRGSSAIVREAVRRLDVYGGSLPVGALARGLGTTPRSLERRFRTEVGLSPKRLARVLRLQAAAAALEVAPESPARVAGACGFSDQPHLVREFQALAGVSPGRWLKEAQGLAVAFVQSPASTTS